MSDFDANVSATVDFDGSDTVSLHEENTKPDGFYHGAVWSLKKLAAWLQTTNFVADDEASQRAVDNTKMLIAEQAKQAAANLQDRK